MRQSFGGSRSGWAVALCALLAAAISFGVQREAASQQLEELLRRVQEQAPQTRRVLDQSRANAARFPFTSPLSGREPPPGSTEESDRFFTFNNAEAFLIERFCRGEVGPGNADEPRLIGLRLRFSELEKDYCRRVKTTVLQYGYDFFDNPFTPEVLVNGAIRDDYLLGIGDELIVTFHGQQTGTQVLFVDREGRVLLDKMKPIAAAGRSFGEFRGELEARTATAFLGTDVFVSLGSVRLVSVVVAGEVRRPGLHRLTGLSTIIDALGLAGGIKKTGSLRRVQVQRGAQIFWLDLYDLLITGATGQSLALFNGDRIFVPTVGPTMAVAGGVKRPGIYELAEGESSITIRRLLEFAGGPLRPKGLRFYHVSFGDDGREQVRENVDRETAAVDGDIVMVQRRRDVLLGSVELAGHVRVPGARSLIAAPTVRALVGDRDSFKADPYLLFAVLETTDPTTRARRLFPVNLRRILDGAEDFSLRDNDRLVVLNADEIRYLSSTDVQDVILGRPVPGLVVERGTLAAVQERTRSAVGGRGELEAAGEEAERRRLEKKAQQIRARNLELLGIFDEGSEEEEEKEDVSEGGRASTVCAGLKALANVISSGHTARFDSAIRAGLSERELEFNLRRPCPPLFEGSPDFLPFLLEHVVSVNGEVRRPGAYPITEETPLASVIAVADGLTRGADLIHVELSRLPIGAAAAAATVVRTFVDLRSDGAFQTAINPGDALRFNAIFTDRDSGPILLSGEFIRPGLYDIRRGERLSEIMVRAGGLTAQAYPYGAVFTRERVKRAEEEGFARASREINSGLSVLASRINTNPQHVAALQAAADRLKATKALGRVVIEADPVVLRLRREFDTVLEPGDRFFMPKRPNFVSVTGDVLSPGTLQFVAGASVDDYLGLAGGTQPSADDGRIFMVLPNGEAQRVAVSVWDASPVNVPPGSTIIVPRDPAPFDFLGILRVVAPVLSQLAVTAASLSVISTR